MDHVAEQRMLKVECEREPLRADLMMADRELAGDKPSRDVHAKSAKLEEVSITFEGERCRVRGQR